MNNLENNDQNEKTEQLCLALMEADTEDEVVEILKDAGYWDNRDVWRGLGDIPGKSCAAVIENLKRDPDNALVEKITNSIDAILMGECIKNGITPNGADAPETIQEAVGKFIEPGNMVDWKPSRLDEIIERITVVATGLKSTKGTKTMPSFTISDNGEGQTPDGISKTFLSMLSSNKSDINFVQGKYQTGGGAVIQFCSEKHRLQFILSRKDPEILDLTDDNDIDDCKWGFSVTRRYEPTAQNKLADYCYLAPLGASGTPNKGKILRFNATDMPIFPGTDKEPKRNSSWGSFIKLYEYITPSYHRIHTHNGLMNKVGLFLPKPALPVKFYDLRYTDDKWGGDNMMGLYNRLVRDTKNVVEEDFPIEEEFRINGRKIHLSMFALKPEATEKTSKRYYIPESDKYGLLYILNGQVHEALPISFFEKKLKIGYAGKALIAFVDCSNLENKDIVDIFRSSRDKINKEHLLYKKIEKAIEEFIKTHPQIIKLNDRRRELTNSAKHGNPKSRDDLLNEIFKNPSLQALLSPGAFPSKSSGKPTPKVIYKGEKFPTFFEFKKANGKNSKCNFARPVDDSFSIDLKTDAEDRYFIRTDYPGKLRILQKEDEQWVSSENYGGKKLKNGTLKVRLGFPTKCEKGDLIEFKFVIENERPDAPPFETTLECIVSATEHKFTPNPPCLPKPKKELGTNLPKMVPVKEDEWGKHGFDKDSSLKIVLSLDSQERDDYFVNVDNINLSKQIGQIKAGEPGQGAIVKTQFEFANVFLGAALSKANRDNEKKSDGGDFVELDIEKITSALAPVLVPMISELSNKDALKKFVESAKKQN